MTLLPDLLIERAALRAGRDALGERTPGGWRWRSWGAFAERAMSIAAGLCAAGVRPGRAVGILARSRPEWVEVEFGTFLAGGVVVPLHPAITSGGAMDIVRRADVRVAFVEDPVQGEKLLAALAPGGPISRIVAFDPVSHLAGSDARGRLEVSLGEMAVGAPAGALSPLHEFTDMGAAELRRGARDEIGRRREALRPDDPATIIFTASDAGDMRGAVLTHDNLAFTTATLGAELSVTAEDRTLLFLPLAHVYPRLLVWTAVQVGFAVAFTEDRRSVLRDAGDVRPDFLIAVPRFLEAVRRGLDREAASGPSWRRAALAWACGTTDNCGQDARATSFVGRTLAAVRREAADRLVWRGLRERLGGRLRFIVSGGAPLDDSTREFFESIGIPVQEGYGMTEGTALTTFTRPGERRPGAVGRPAGGVEIGIAADGEILFRGRNVMRGYLDDPEATAEVIDADGWLRSGDLGVLEHDGVLRITGRKKDIIVTEGGKNVSPRQVESLIRDVPLVRDVVVVGDRRPYLVALIALEPREIAKAAVLEGIIIGPPEEMEDHPAIRAMIEDAITDCNRRLDPFQAVRAFAVVPDLGSRPSHADPAAARLRRTEIEKRYADRIEAMYAREHSAFGIRHSGIRR